MDRAIKFRTAIFGSLTLLSASSLVAGYLYFNNLSPDEELSEEVSLAIENSENKILENIHFIKRESMPVKENTITLYFSYSSKESLNAYSQLLQLIDSLDKVTLEVIHLNLNENWQIPYKTFETLQILKSPISQEDVFKFFINNKKIKSKSDVTPLLLNNNIDTYSFFEIYDSLEITKKSAQDFESMRSSGIEFVPDIYINGNQQVILGAFKNYSELANFFK
ncbi:hypothetical protein L1267_12415 [Pseudoalteromonas sp. OFAV1]|uniref:hypothetical protein n=1 Tax=Pseudoalteromonas sp. OFAV1 TaxID=2908892 RepID=UPI001F1D5D25|nr:hypothetical protein [Pseudoalteromonas sp. OFAV1]MCF2901196.1 hypothetical protein [Pseudoalteromonas sp. OFAV1]